MTRTRKWSLLSALLAVVILLAGWFLLVSPTRSSADTLHQQAVDQQAHNDTLNAKIAELEAKKQGLPQQEAEIAAIQQQIPPNPELPALIRSLSSMADSAGVDLHTLTPVAPVASAAQAPANAVGAQGQTLQVISATMEVDGTYYNVERFLNKMETLKRALLVTGITLNVKSGDGTTGSQAVAAQVGVSPQLAAIISFRAFMVSSAVAPGTSPVHATTPTTTTSTAPASSTPAQ